MSIDHAPFMRLAIEQARAGISKGQSPFGAIVVRGGSVVGVGHNEVWHRTDPTAHAEVVCIQNTARALRTIDLAGCTMYTTTEPCPMCASAIHWSKLDAVYFGARIADAEGAGFSEIEMPIERLYAEGKSPVKAYVGVMAQECAALFAEWKRASGRAY
jgi:tRNA(Arg) A34 adenosine deaminase TadA